MKEDKTGCVKISDKARGLALKISELIELLEEYETYKDFDSILKMLDDEVLEAKNAYQRLNTNKSFMDYFSAIANRSAFISEHKKVTLEKLEARLKSFESFIDRKYWDEVSLIEIWDNLLSHTANSIEEAVEMFEKGRQN